MRNPRPEPDASRAETITAAPQRIGALVAISMHALLGAALLSHEPTRTAMFAAVPVMVELISPPRIGPRPEPPVEIPPRPKPRPVVEPLPRQPDPPPLLAAPVQAPTPVEVAPPPPQVPAPVAAMPLAAVQVTAPVFDADYLENPPPPYPAQSRRRGEQGRVVLRVLVDPGGAADEVQIRSSSGFLRLDNAARETVLAWRFAPAKRGERPVPAWVLIPISFSLEGQ